MNIIPTKTVSVEKHPGEVNRMKLPLNRVARGIAAGILCLLFITAAHAEDTAIVIGINQYSRLGKGTDLQGCVHDAETMRDLLKGYGFNVTFLTDKKADHKAIQEAIKRAGKKMDAKSRFVCYFAGYGVSNVRENQRKEAAILPADARADKDENDLSVLSLYQSIEQLPAVSKTLILDTCFAGLLLRKKDDGDLKPRFFLRTKSERLWKQGDPNNAEAIDPAIQNGKTVLFSAAMRQQIAYERGREGGVFTKALVQEMSQKPSCWQDVQARVAAQVSGATNSEQHPLLLPVAFLNKSVLSSAPAPATANNATLLDTYNMSRPSRFVVSVNIEPKKTIVQVNEKVNFKATVGSEGYLILVGIDPVNQFDVIFPQSDDIEKAHVFKGSFYVGKDLHPDTPGNDQLKGFWFPSSERESAESFLHFVNSKKVGGSGTAGNGADGSETRIKSAHFATSELLLRIVPMESEPANPPTPSI